MDLLYDNTLQAAFGARDASSPAMLSAIGHWRRLYLGREGCLRLPYTVVRKLTRAVFAEYVPPASLRNLPHRQAMELALVGGESYLKPTPQGDTLTWTPIARGDILIFARDHLGNPTDLGLVERRTRGRDQFTLLERRSQTPEGMLLTNRLLRNGREVPLSTLDCYANLPAGAELPDPGGLGLARLKMPMLNCVDGSNDGVSVYAPATALLERIEENEEQLRREFANGASRLVVSRDLLTAGQLKDSVFVALDEAPETVGITVFNPQLREQSYINRQQSYLRALENIIGLKRGLLSQVEAVDRTATEITSSEGEYMTTIRELREAWEQTARDALTILENLTGQPQTEAPIQWGDGIV